MNKLKLSRLCAAVDIYYKKSQALIGYEESIKLGQRSSPNERIQIELQNFKRLVNTFVDGSNASETLKKWTGEKQKFNEVLDQALQNVMTVPLTVTKSTLQNALSQLGGFNKEMTDSNFYNVYKKEGDKLLSQIDLFATQQPAVTETKPSESPTQPIGKTPWWSNIKFPSQETTNTTPARTPSRAPIAEREDVRNAQNALYTNYGLGADLGLTGVDGKLGDKTRAALKKAKPGMTVDQAISALSEEWKQSQVAAPEPLPAPATTSNSTWGGERNKV